MNEEEKKANIILERLSYTGITNIIYLRQSNRQAKITESGCIYSIFEVTYVPSQCKDSVIFLLLRVL